ncbi:NUDIX hydrolase [Nocardia cyriacigeorgica]|uniref:NUDIX hydrolase n=1 Tax=Nocardia cyriacigeorgica TaxID=135487 RepID=UPI002456ECE9|nr:NUDIX hydrolase [Nocardia cyriacigeorgica]
MRETAHLTADVVLLAGPDTDRHVLLITRGKDPFTGRLALPGGHVDADEFAVDAAARELAEETGIALGANDLTEIGTYSAPGRDPRGRYVSLGFVAHVPAPITPTAGDDAATAAWYPVAQVYEQPDRWAFDHRVILADALAHLYRQRSGGITTTTTVSGSARVGKVVGTQFGRA